MNSKPTTESKYTTYITHGSRFEGNLKTSDNVRIDGEFIGDLEVTGKLVTGENSFIKGNLSAIDVIIGGRVNGAVKGVWSVTLLETSNLKGDLNTEELVLEKGACFDGYCSMKQGAVQEGASPNVLLQEA